MRIKPDEMKTLATIALGVATNRLTSLLALSDRENAKQAGGGNIFEILQVLYQTMIELAEDGRWSDASRGVEILSIFLRTPEVEEIVHQIYTVKLHRHHGESDVSSLRSLFVALLTSFLTAYAPEPVPGN